MMNPPPTTPFQSKPPRPPSSSFNNNNNNNHNDQEEQQQQQQPHTTTNESERDRALREAQQVMDSDSFASVEGFNLLGVVANPRTGGFAANAGTMMPSSSFHGNSSSTSIHGGSPQRRLSSQHESGGGGSTTTPAGAAPTTGTTLSSSDSLWNSGVESLVAMEQSLMHVTEQIENLNHVFDSWSRHYLGNLYEDETSSLEYMPPSDVHAYLLQELPPELASLSLESVQNYLESCGVLSHNFYQRCEKFPRVQHHDNIMEESSHGEQQQQQQQDDKEETHHQGDTHDHPTDTSQTQQQQQQQQQYLEQQEDDFMDDLYDNVPDSFFETYFDLTDPKTFCELLVLEAQAMEEEEHGEGATAAAAAAAETPEQVLESSEDLSSLHLSLRVPTKEILRLPPPDSFTGHLDKVEVALLKQVRSKSDAFFHETNRFGQLKEWISSLVKDVQSVQQRLQQVQDGSVVAWELIPRLDARRQDLERLQHVLENANEVLRTKSSIGGLLSASDDLMAAEQIQYGRRLLSGTAASYRKEQQSQQNGGDAVEEEEEEEEEEDFEMARLQALTTVGDQFSEYEKVVVANLSEELVETFLSWKMSPSLSTSLYVGSPTDFTTSLTTTTTMNGSSGAHSLPRTAQETQQRVRDTVRALGMCQYLSKTGQAYQNRLNDVIRMTVRTTVAEFSGDFGPDQEKDDLAPTSSTTTTTTTTPSNKKETSVTVGVTSMSFDRFMDCIDMLFEQLLALLKSAVGVNNFCREEGFTLKDEDDSNTTTKAESTAVPPSSSASQNSAGTSGRTPTATSEAVTSAAELSAKSVSEVLRLRKEAHSLVNLEEMKRLWDACLSFTLQVEKASGHKAYGLRSTLLAQAKAFVERKHESNMSALVAALDSERWSQCDVSSERQSALTRLCSGRAVLSSKRYGADDSKENGEQEKMSEAEVEGIRYKVVWSCLLLVEMVMTNLACASQFQALATNLVGKVAELLRLFNSRSTKLVLGAGAIQSAARLKSINAKHLSLVTQCVGMVISILPHVRAALMAQLPSKQHTLLVDLDKIKKEYAEHSEMVLNKFVNIIGGIVEHGLAPRISSINFDSRAKANPLPAENVTGPIPCCVFLEGVNTNIKKMHQVLNALLPNVHMQDVFSRIFAYVDQKIPAILISAAAASSAQSGKPAKAGFNLPQTDEGKRRMILEVESMTINLNNLAGVRPWDFTAMNVLERKLDYELRPKVEVHPAETVSETVESLDNASETVESLKNGSSAEVSKEVPSSETDEKKAEHVVENEPQESGKDSDDSEAKETDATVETSAEESSPNDDEQVSKNDPDNEMNGTESELSPEENGGKPEVVGEQNR